MKNRLIKLTIIALIFTGLAIPALAAVDVTLINPTASFVNSAAWGSGIRLSVITDGGAPIDYVKLKISYVNSYGEHRYWDNSAGSWTDESSYFEISPGTSPIWAWNTTDSDFYWGGREYRIDYIVHYDGTRQSNSYLGSFTYDNTIPIILSYSYYISDGSVVNSVSPLTGYTQDNETGIELLAARLWYSEGGHTYYWAGGSSWQRDLVVNAPAPSIVSGALRTPRDTVCWSFEFPALVSGRTYSYQTFSYDRAMNPKTRDVISFSYDNVAPTLTMTLPDSSSNNYCAFTGTGADAKYNGTAWDKKIAGAVSDPAPGSGLSRVELQIIRNRSGVNYYFNGTSWVSSATIVLAAISHTNFSYLLPSGFFSGVINGDIITINATAYDALNNSTAITGRVFKIDTQKPTSAITTGGSSGYISTYPSSLTGTTTDNLSPDSVKLYVKRTHGTDIKYWGETVIGFGINPLTHDTYPIYGYGWVTSVSSATATVSGTGTSRSWSFSAGTMFSDAQVDDTFTVTAQSTDRAGNQESPGVVKTIRRDPTLPFVSVTAPASHFKATNKPIAINVTATDNSGITSVKVKINRNGLNYDWLTSRWELVSANLYKTATLLGGTSYQVSLPTNFYDDLLDGHRFTFYIQAQNGAGATTTITTDPIIYDNTAPLPPTASSSAIKWQNTPNGRMDQSLDYTDGSDPLPSTGLSASGLANYYVQVKDQMYDTIASGTIVPGASYTWTMASEGIFTVRMMSYDNANNWSSARTDILFGYDATPPGDFNITNPSNGSTIDTTTPPINWTAAVDFNPYGFDPSGIDRYEVYIDGASSPATTTSDTSLNLPAGSLTNGSHTLAIVAVDKAGNTREKSSSFTVRTRVAPTITLSSPANDSMVNISTVNLTGSIIDDSLVNSVTLTVNGSTSTLFAGASANVVLNQPVSLMTGNNSIALRAVDDTGDATEVTRTVFCDTDNPAAFNVIYPTNDGWAIAKPTFKWGKSSDATSGLLGYDLYVDSVKVNEYAIEGESFEYPSTLSDDSHTYKVIAWDKAGNYYDTGIINFNVDSAAPAAPTLALPLNGQVMTSNFKIAWSASTDTRSGIDRYEVYVGDAKIGSTADTSLWTTTLPEDGAFDVKVIAYDKAGNTSTSNKVSVVINVNPPTISLLVNNKSIANGDRINTLPKLKAEIRDASGVDPASIKILVDGVAQTTSNLQTLSAIEGSVTSYNASKEDLRLSAGKHTIKIEAKDLQGKSTVREFTDLGVSGKTEITGFVMNYPNPIKPSTTGTTINYTLVDDATLKIMIYDLSGRLINKLDCLEGAEGGRFGENNVPYDGKTFTGDILANGAYVYLIVDSKNNVIGSGEMAVYE